MGSAHSARAVIITIGVKSGWNELALRESWSIPDLRSHISKPFTLKTYCEWYLTSRHIVISEGGMLERESLPWFALRTKSRHEKAVCCSLSQRGFTPFVPLYQARHRWKDRTVTVELPLFSTYVFCQFEPSRRVEILKAPGVWEIVSSGHTPLEVQRGEVDALRRVLASGMPVEPWRYISAGEHVRVADGPLKGAEGVLIDAATQPKLVVSITLLQRSIMVELDAEAIEPIGGADFQIRYLRAAESVARQKALR